MNKKVLTVMLSAVLSTCLTTCPAFAGAAVPDGDPSISSVSGITQFSDGDQIQNKEAVSVLTGLGVIDGMGDGTFQPQGTLTRAQTAKLISVFTGYRNTNGLTGGPEKLFTDVPATHWASGYISFGVSQKYLNGMGDGTFDPEGRVTTAHLATILDKLLGYVPRDVNQLWPTRAMDIADTNGLLINIAKTAGEPLSREEAAQMMLNALEADTRLLAGDNEAENGTYSYQEIRNSTEQDYRKRNGNTSEQLVERLFPNVTCRYYSDDDLGHERRIWRNDRNEHIAEYPIVPAITYTSRKTSNEVTADLAGCSLQDAELWLNACKVPSSEGYLRSCGDLAELLTGNGVRTEIYTDNTKKKVTKIITVHYSLKKVLKSDSGKEFLNVENGSRSTVLTARADFFDRISSAVVGDRILAAPAYHYTKDRTGLHFKEDWSDLVDAYMPYILQGNVKYTMPVTMNMERTISVDGTPYFLMDGYHGEDLENTAGGGTAYLDRYGYFAGYESAETKDDTFGLLFVKELYRTRDLSANTFVWHLKGYSETGQLLDLPINDSGTEASASAVGSLRTTADTRSQKTFTWFRPYKEKMDSFGTIDGSADPQLSIAENRVFLKDGKAVCYQESAAGCFLSEDNRDGNGGIRSYAFSTKENLIGDHNYIAGIRLSDSFRTVIIGGSQPDGLNVTVSTRAENVPADSVCIVKTNSPNSLRITSVFTEKESYETATRATLLRVTGIAGACVYMDASGEARNDGVLVSYYDADSPDEKTMIVASSETGAIRPGWYGKLTTFGEATILEEPINDATSLRWDRTTKSMTGGFYSGSIVSGYNGTITVAGELSGLLFQFTGDEAVRDLSGSGFRTVNELIQGISSGQFTGKVVFSFTSRDEQNLITQLYILK